jgi:hypothetical protein
VLVFSCGMSVPHAISKLVGCLANIEQLLHAQRANQQRRAGREAQRRRVRLVPDPAFEAKIWSAVNFPL